MQKVKALSKFQRISPRKVRFVLGVIRGLKATDALNQVRFLPQRAARYVEDVLKSAVANAVHNHKLEKGSLYVLEAFADQAGIMKRFNPVSRGRAYPIKKRLSHITIMVGPKEEKK